MTYSYHKNGVGSLKHGLALLLVEHLAGCGKQSHRLGLSGGHGDEMRINSKQRQATDRYKDPYKSLKSLAFNVSFTTTFLSYTFVFIIIMSPAWNRLIRFVASDGNTYYGEPIVASENATVDQLATQGTLEAKVISGDALSDDAVVTDQVVKVSQLLAPLAQSEVPIFKCVGLNYKAHSKQHSTRQPRYIS